MTGDVTAAFARAGFTRSSLVAGNASSLLRQDAKRPRAKRLFEAGTFARGPLVAERIVSNKHWKRCALSSMKREWIANGPRTARVQSFRGERSEPLALGLLASWRNSENERPANGRVG